MVALFVITLDVLKYIFNIDPVGPIPPKVQPKKQKKKKKVPIAIRYTYVNELPKPSSEQVISTIEQTVV